MSLNLNVPDTGALDMMYSIKDTLRILEDLNGSTRYCHQTFCTLEFDQPGPEIVVQKAM